LQGTILFEKPVIHPNRIASFDYDQIIIAAMDTYNITRQLVNECGVKPDVVNGTLFPPSWKQQCENYGIEKYSTNNSWR
jgi:hypothetical protein